MKYIVCYCNDGTPSKMVFDNKKQMQEWVVGFLFKNECTDGSWIDYIFKGVELSKDGKFEILNYV